MLDFFVPCDSVAVFDHLVERPVLDSVKCFIVCGHALSAKIFAAIQARVNRVCFAKIPADRFLEPPGLSRPPR